MHASFIPFALSRIVPSNKPISAIFRKEVLAMSAYKVVDASGLIKLDAMENPYSWPEALKEKWLQVLKECQLNRYPDPQARQLVETIRRLNHIPNQFDILLGNGSDEIILLLPAACSSRILFFLMQVLIAECLHSHSRFSAVIECAQRIPLPVIIGFRFPVHNAQAA